MENREQFETAYGLYLEFSADSMDEMRRVLMEPAHKTVEVAVKYNDTVKEFTFSDFFHRLGFEYDGDAEA